VLPHREIDAREHEDWFLRLPAAEQEGLRRHWHERRLHGPAYAARQRRRARRAMRTGAFLLCAPLFGVNVLLLGLGPLLLLLLVGAAAGAGVGLLVHGLGAGRFGAALIGCSSWLTVQLLGGAVFATGALVESAPPLMLLFLGLWASANLFGVWGQRLEFQGLEGDAGARAP